MGDSVQTRTVAELRAYLRRRRATRGQATVVEFEDFLKDVSQLFALRVASEEYWAGSPRGSEFNFLEHRYQAVSVRGALPLEWNEIHAILVPDKDKPRSTLITYVAAHCIEEVRGISSGLRRILSRERVMTPVGKVQQLDSCCMQWLMRQPGRDFAEKGGVQQRVMAVVRRERYDTLENRVFKDFLIRAENLASSYLDEIQERFSSHRVYVTVKHFRMACQFALSLPEMDLISGLSILPQPNYVLQQDNRYSKIWTAYLRIVRLAALAEKLWGLRNLLKTKLDKLAKESCWQAEHANDAYYHSLVWINPLTGGADFTEYTLTHHRLADGELMKRRIARKRKRPVENGVGIVDLSDDCAWGAVLCRGGLHSNAKPRIHDDFKPLIDDEEGACKAVDALASGVAGDAKRLSLATIVSHANDPETQDAHGEQWETARANLADYSARLFGEYRNEDRAMKELVVLSSDDWNPVMQECVIRSFHMVERRHVHLLWRSVAAALGFDEHLQPLLSENDVVAVLDFRNDGTILVTGLKYLADEPSGRLIPQRGVFMRNGRVNSGRHALYGADDFGALVSCWIVRNAKALCVVGDVSDSFWAYLRKSLRFLHLRDDDQVRVGRIVNGQELRCVLADGASGWAQKRGAIKFCHEHEKRTLYYDELEPMWVVGQGEKENVAREEIVASNERFAGGTMQEIPLPDGLMKIGEGQKAVTFLFHVGELSETTRLHEYKEDLPGLVARTAVRMSGSIVVSPGQGIAITTIKSRLFKEPLVLDYLRNMTLSKWSIEKLEKEMPRSYPPTCAVVEAYPMPNDGLFAMFMRDTVLTESKRCIEGYLSGKLTLKDVPDATFARALRKKETELKPGESRLHLIDRWNVFGNVEGASRPYWLSASDEEKLLNKLVFHSKDKKFSDKCLRLLAWMYRGDSPKVRGLVSAIVRAYEGKESSVGGLKRVQATFLANYLSARQMRDLKRRAWRTLCARLANMASRKGEDLRLFYNLFQFDPEIFADLGVDLVRGCDVAAILLRDLTSFRNVGEPMNYKSGVRAFLYFLRLREKERYFLRPEETIGASRLPMNARSRIAALYERAVVEFSTPFQKNESEDMRMLREATLKFLRGAGTLKDIVNVEGGDEEE